MVCLGLFVLLVIFGDLVVLFLVVFFFVWGVFCCFCFGVGGCFVIGCCDVLGFVGGFVWDLWVTIHQLQPSPAWASLNQPKPAETSQPAIEY